MLVKISEDENHNKIVKPIAGATLGQGVPLGAWCSFEKDVAPSNNWLMAGTTFDATVYPALNLYLGTNKVPSRYDHSRLDPPISVLDTWVNQRNTPSDYFTAPYDGYLIISHNSNNFNHYTNWGLFQSADGGTTFENILMVYDDKNSGIPITVPIKKGWKYYGIHYETNSTEWNSTFAEYYSHPLFIKATSIASDSDKDSILAQIQEYNTYSTEETLTGKTWIDGKPIYRCVIPFLNKQTVNSSGSTLTVGTALPSNLPFGNFSNISNFINGFIYRNNVNTITPLAVRYNSQTQITVFSIDGLGDTDGIILEYTKTND